MQAAAITNRFLTGCPSSSEFLDPEILVSNADLLQQTILSHLAQAVHSQELLLKLTNSLIRFAEQAFTQRDLNALEEASRILMNMPVDAARQIGIYYYALVINRRGQRDEAKVLFERVADHGPVTYRARAIQTLGTGQHYKGHLDEGLRLQLEALRVAADKNARGLQTALLARWETSIIKSDLGDHKGALSGLKALSPLVNLVAQQRPFYAYAHCNALAIELGELGHTEEAMAACHIALASPFAAAYPEWTETRQELEEKRTSATPSVVAITRASEPEVECEPSPQIRPEAEPSSKIRPQADPSPLIEPQRQPKRSKLLNLTRAAKAAKTARTARDNVSFQRSVISIPAKTTFAFNAVSILDRVFNCISPRAPPTCH